VLTWCSDGVLQPHVQEVVPLARTADALGRIDARQAVGKIVVRP